MGRKFLAAAMFALLAVMSQAQTTDLFDKLIFADRDRQLPYRLLKPVNPGAEDKFPLVIFLHGAGERGNDNEAQLKHISNLFLDPNVRGKFPCYVLAPQCPAEEVWANYSGKPNTELSPSLQSVLRLLEKITSEYRIDRTRIYVTGVSMGGFGTWKLLSEKPELFAAGVPVCGGGDVAYAQRISRISIWAFHGAKDDVISPERSRKMVKALQDAGGSPGYTEYPDIAHDSWVQAYQEPHLLPWLFKQKKTLPTAK